MGSYDFVTADKFGKNSWPYFWPLVSKFGSSLAIFWARFDPLAKSRSGNPVLISRLLERKSEKRDCSV